MGIRPIASYELRIQSDDDCSRRVRLSVLHDHLRAIAGMHVGDGDFAVWRDDARGLVMEVRAQFRGDGGKVTRATAGAPPGREAWSDVNRVSLSIPLAHLPEGGPQPYVVIAEAIASAVGWKVWDAVEDRYLLPRNRRPSEPPPVG